MRPSRETAFSITRARAVFIKEFQQMFRDKLTFAMAVAIPILQLVLFGYAINTDPKKLPTAIVSADHSPFERSFVTAVENTGYFAITSIGEDENAAVRDLDAGAVQFVIVIPAQFSQELVRSENPAILVTVDATDPSASGNAIAALNSLVPSAITDGFNGALSGLKPRPSPFELRIHRKFNPEGLSRYNIVPGLLGTILTMTMVMLTALAMTRESERGTLENLLATPVKSIEVMVGKILPYVILGYIQIAVVLIVGVLLFKIPIYGSVSLLLLLTGLFVVANLAVGFTFSTIARSQLQAMQLTFFFFLPSILLSGFMFPFKGMPTWAQWIGEFLPLTHYLRIVRGILLKANTIIELSWELAAIILFILTAGIVAILRYRQTLDQ